MKKSFVAYMKKTVLLFWLFALFLNLAACSENTDRKGTENQGDFYGDYIFEKQVYMNPLSSFIAFDGYEEYYTFTEDAFVLTGGDGVRRRTAVSYEEEKWDKKLFDDLFMMQNGGTLDVTAYEKISQYALRSEEKVLFRLFLLDDVLWLARIHESFSEVEEEAYIWSIFKIQRLEGAVPNQAVIEGKADGVENFLQKLGGFSSEEEMGTYFNVTPKRIEDNSDYQVFKNDTSCASFLLYEDTVYPMGGWFGGNGVVNMALGDMNRDGMDELYFTYSWGSGIHRSQAAYFDPAEKKMVDLDCVKMFGDMMVAVDRFGGISFYEGFILDFNSFVSMEMEAGELMAEVIFENEKINLFLYEIEEGNG